MANLRNCNFLVAALCAASGFVIAMTSYGYGIDMTDFGPGPGFWPFILGVALCLVATLLFFDSVKHSEEYKNQPITLTAPQNIGAYQMMALVLCYTVLIFIIGFYAGTALFLVTAMVRLGADNKMHILAVTALFLAFIYILFGMLLHISLPLPFFME